MKNISNGISRLGYLLAAVVTSASALAVLPVQPVSADGGSTGNGSVVSSQALSLPAELSSVATAKKVLYNSTDSSGANVVVSAAVLTPKAEYLPATGPRDVVAWAHGTEGIADQCAPTNNTQTFDTSTDYLHYRDALRSYLMQGWTVAATDYQGLGTAGTHQYFNGDTEARSVIDSVRAARHLDSSLSNKWVVTGHSQGGQAALFANEIADSYGQGLKLRGSVAIAPVSNLDILAAGVPGTPANGYLVFALVGLAASDSSVDVNTLLAQPAKDLLSVVETGCWVEVLTAYQSLTAEELVVGGALPQTILDKLAQLGNPAQQSPTAPTLLVQGEDDPVIPVGITQYLQAQMCSYGKPVQLGAAYPGKDHDTVIDASQSDVNNYIRDRFDGVLAPSNC
jgi:alpha-beta hydrolase superfamily lysophospholipase